MDPIRPSGSMPFAVCTATGTQRKRDWNRWCRIGFRRNRVGAPGFGTVGAPAVSRKYRRGSAACTVSLRAGDELLEPRVLAQGVEVGVDLEPVPREKVGDL
jgi:hypothetical protein